MDCLSLIQHAQDAGLKLRIDAGRLVIRGPKRCADLAARLTARKAEVIDALQAGADVDTDYDAGGERQAIQGEARRAGRGTEPAIAQADEAADAGRYAAWNESIDEAGRAVLTHPDYAVDVELIDGADLTPCPQCESLELWQSAAGTWRCCKCEPPTRARELRELAERIRKRFPSVKTATAKALDE